MPFLLLAFARILLATLAVPPTPRGNLPLPATPAGRSVAAWLGALDSGDSVRLAAYYRKYGFDRSFDLRSPRRMSTGGFDVVSIEKNRPRYIEVVLRARETANRVFVICQVSDHDDLEITQFSVVPIPAGIAPAGFRIDGVTRGRVIHEALAALDANYVFPGVARQMMDSVRARLEHAAYDSVTNGVTLASLLTRHLRAISHDLHLTVTFSPAQMPDPNLHRDSAAFAEYRREMKRRNCGFERAEHLKGNVGYVKVNFFADPDVCGSVASAAMSSVADVDALILDLRENGGGMPQMVAYMCSYLFSGRVHLNDLWARQSNRVEEFWTRNVPGKKIRERTPVYVLTAARTFSGAEEFAYDLQNLKRATIVGETTGGGAHPVFTKVIDRHFAIAVPYARSINPVSKTDWEGVGVHPDVNVAANEALVTALRMISRLPGQAGRTTPATSLRP